jgi:hypothetical protein
MGRRCGTCTLCCKLLAVQELAKPAHTACTHCIAGQGCQIYDARPKQCRLFNCHFLENPKLAEEWRPSKSHIVLVRSPDGQRVSAQVDPQWPGAWRRKQFYAQLKAWARESVSRPGRLGQVFVIVGKKAIVILPDRDIDVGDVEADEIIITEGRPGPKGMTFNAFKVKRDDPRAGLISHKVGKADDAIF